MIINRLSRQQRRMQLIIGSKPMNLVKWNLEKNEKRKERKRDTERD